MKLHHQIVLFQFDPGGEEDPGRLKQLFRVTQHLMNLKAAEAQVAEEQAEEEGKNAEKQSMYASVSCFCWMKVTVKCPSCTVYFFSEQELNKARREKEELERELKNLRVKHTTKFP